MRVLGIQFGSHDTSAAIVDDGKLLAMVEQERCNGVKHTLAFPRDSVRECVKLAQVRVEEFDCIAYAGDADARNPQPTEQRSSAFVLDFYDRQSYEDELRSQLQVVEPELAKIPFFAAPHHYCHAASSYFLSPFPDSAILTVDGLGNWVSAAGFIGHGSTIQPLFAVHHPHSLGFFYGAATQFLGFRALGDEAKVMGLAAYGHPRYLNKLRAICRCHAPQFELDLDYFTFHRIPAVNSDGAVNTWYSQKFVEEFGPPRRAESEITARDEDLAASIQQLLEERVFEILTALHQQAGLPQLCLAGGVALNSSMNGKVCAATPFRELFVVPAANDAGLSVGAALACVAARSPDFRREALTHAYYGSDCDDSAVERELASLDNCVIQGLNPQELVSATAQLLANQQVVGWFQGRMEFGPRALGNRSILASPALSEMKTRINQQIKFREDFRPLAPVVPLEHVGLYFETENSLPFMLQVVKVREQMRTLIPAVTHVDGSARVQTVTAQQNLLLHNLLLEMRRLTGISVLLNTSFNVRSTTIVRTPRDAINCFRQTGIDALAIGRFLVLKHAPA